MATYSKPGAPIAYAVDTTGGTTRILISSAGEDRIHGANDGFGWRGLGATAREVRSGDRALAAFGTPDTFVNRFGDGMEAPKLFTEITLPKGVDAADFLRGTLDNVDRTGKIRDTAVMDEVGGKLRQANQGAADAIRSSTGREPQQLGRDMMGIATGAEAPGTHYKDNISIEHTADGKFRFGHKDLGGAAITVSITADPANPSRLNVNATETLDSATRKTLADAAAVNNKGFANIQMELRREVGNALKNIGVSDVNSLLSGGHARGDLKSADVTLLADKYNVHAAEVRASRDVGAKALAATADSVAPVGSDARATIDKITDGATAKQQTVAVGANGDTVKQAAAPDAHKPNTSISQSFDPNGALAKAAVSPPPTAAKPSVEPDIKQLLQGKFQPSEPAALRAAEAPKPSLTLSQLTAHPPVQPEPAKPVAAPHNPNAGDRVLSPEEIAQMRAANRKQMDALDAARRPAGPANNTPAQHAPEPKPAVVAPEQPKPMQLGNSRLDGEHRLAPAAAPEAPHTAPSTHTASVRAGSAGAKILGVAGGAAIAGLVSATTAGASELVKGNGFSAAVDAAGKAGGEAVLDATPGVNAAKATMEGRDREAHARKIEAMPVIGAAWGEIYRPMARNLPQWMGGGSGDNAPDSRRLDPGFIEGAVTTGAKAVSALGGAVKDKVSSWIGGSDNKVAEKPVEPTKEPQAKTAEAPTVKPALSPDMQKAVDQAKASGAASQAQAQNMVASDNSNKSAPAVPKIDDYSRSTARA